MSVPADPIEAVLSGVKHAWAFVLGPSLALMVGTALGVFAGTAWVDFAYPPGYVPTLSVVIVPMSMFSTTFGQLLAIVTAVSVLGFWAWPTWRIEAWLVIAIAAGVEAFRLFAEPYSVWQFVRICIACGVLAGIHTVLRVVPMLRYGREPTRRRRAAHEHKVYAVRECDLERPDDT